MRLRFFRMAGVLFLMVVASLAIALASESASFSGIVEDPEGFPIPNAQVQLKDKSGATVAAVIANETGHFAASLPAGDYTLTATADGFKAASIPVEVGAGNSPQQHVRLKIAAAQQELTVTAETLDPVAADGSVGAIQVDHDLLKSLPVKDGNPLAAASLFLDPSASGSDGVKVVVDGIEGGDLDVPSSSVKKVFINKNPYSPEFGRPGKGRIEVTTRPGSLHRIHHRGFFTYRNSIFDARNAFAPTKPDMSRMLAEGEMDGPMPGKKGTFYIGGDYLRDNQNAFVHALTPGGLVSENLGTPERSGHLLARTDWQLNPIHTLSMRYAFSKDTRANQGTGGFDLAERAYSARQRGHEFRVSETANFSANLTNEVRFAFKHRIKDAAGLSDAPATIVLGAFSSGGAQISQHQAENDFELQDVANIIRGKHMIRLGASVKHRAIDIRDQSNFGGTFTFASLSEFLTGRPVLFTQNSGNPAASIGYMEYSWFVQDEIRMRRDLGLMFGLRHELQSNLADHNNVAPRVSISYAPGAARTVFRLGAGVFYQREPWSIVEAATLLDGSHLRQIVISNPILPFPTTAAAALAPPAVERIAPNLSAPYAVQTSAAIEHKFGQKTFISVEYTRSHGGKLFRMRDLNAPLPLTGLRPDLNFSNVFQFESAGSSTSNSVSVTFRTALKRFELLSQYTLARSMDDTSGPFSLPASSFDLRSEWGRSDYDRRHRLTFAGIARLPYELKLGVLGSLSSGVPFNIVSGTDGNADGVLNDRPLGVLRNTGRGPAYANVDLRLSKRVNLVRTSESDSKAPYAEVRIDAFNLLNATNAQSYVGTITSALFGRANAALPARQLQASVKLSF